MKKLVSMLLVAVLLAALLCACDMTSNGNGGGSAIVVEDDEGEAPKGSGNGSSEKDAPKEEESTAKALRYGIYVEGVIAYEMDEQGRLVGLYMVSELLGYESFGRISEEDGGFMAGFAYRLYRHR